mgnify:CR=1 FL=1
MSELPSGFRCHVTNLGIKDDTDDFVVIAATAPCPAAGVFTKSRFVGPSVTVSREHVQSGIAQAMVIVRSRSNPGTLGVFWPKLIDPPISQFFARPVPSARYAVVRTVACLAEKRVSVRRVVSEPGQQLAARQLK